MRVLVVSETVGRFGVPITPALEARGFEFRRLVLEPLRGPGGGKVRRYLPGRTFIRAVRDAIVGNDPDIIHIGSNRTAALVVVLASRGLRIPILLNHGAIDGLNMLSPFDWLTYFNRRIDRLVLPSRAHVNNWMGRAMLGRCVGADRCSVLPHPIECFDAMGEADRAALRARYGFAPDEVVVGSVCSIRPIKNLAFVAGIVRQLGPPFVFAVVGGGRDAELARLRQAGGDRLRLLGPIPDARRMMAAFDIYVTPTRLPGEAFGLAPAEAMAASVPVLTMNFGGAAEIIEHGLSGLALAADPTAWGEALRRLAADAELRRTMGAAARERIRSRFSVEAVARDCEALYHEVLAART
jgi:glycosyltransferase involved in cell wall biosynthesis